jgi:hypothetical protein
MPGHRVLLVSLCLLGLFAFEKSSDAAIDRRVVLLRPSVTDEVTAMALARIKGELIAAGFEVTVVPQRDDLPSRSLVETAGSELNPLAVFAIVHEPPKVGTWSTAEIWVSDRLVDRTSVERMRLDANEPGRGATVLAVRAVELLKASLAEFWIVPEPPRPAPSPPEQRPLTAKPVAVVRSPVINEGIAAHAAIGILHSFGEIGPVWTPMLQLSYGTADGIGARMTVGGLGSNANLAAPAGTARVQQQFGTAEGFILSRLSGPVQFFGTAGLGAYHLSVDGTGIFPYRAKPTAEAWSLLAGAGVGIAAEVYPHVALNFEGRALWALPPAVVRFDDTTLGKTNWPLLLASMGIGVTL